MLVANVLLGIVGGWLALFAFVEQIERNPFCPTGSWRRPVFEVVALLVVAVILNLVLDRSLSSRAGVTRAVDDNRKLDAEINES